MSPIMNGIRREYIKDLNKFKFSTHGNYLLVMSYRTTE